MCAALPWRCGEPLGNWFVAAHPAIHYGQALPLAIRRILELNRRLPAVSWAIAHIAGRYALSCQQDPGMMPERFLRQMKLSISR